jgi:hypothetical protein
MLLQKLKKTLVFPKRDAVMDLNHPPDLTVVGVLLPQSQFFYCVDCAKEACRTDPSLSHEILFHSDIYPHSQACHQCDGTAVEGEPGMSEKFWRPEVSDQSLQLLLQDLDNLTHHEIDSVEDTFVGMGPPPDQAITLVSIFDDDCDDEMPTRPNIRTSELLAACM